MAATTSDVQPALKTLYFINTQFGNSDICSVDVVKETAKSYIVDRRSRKRIHGSSFYLPDRIPKRDRRYTPYTTLREAQTQVILVLDDLARSLESEARRMRENLDQLSRQFDIPLPH